MSVELLPVGLTANTTIWYTAAADEVVQLMLKPPVGVKQNHSESFVYLQFKNSAGQPVTVQTLGGTSPVVARFQGPADYCLERTNLSAWVGGAGVDRL